MCVMLTHEETVVLSFVVGAILALLLTILICRALATAKLIFQSSRGDGMPRNW